MKKGLFLFIILTFSSFLYSQEANIIIDELPNDLPASIMESDDYKLAQRYREMAMDAHEAGDYNQSIEYSKQSKEYSDKILSRYGVYQFVIDSQRDADRKLGLFKGLGGDTNELTSELYTLSVKDMDSAHAMFEIATNGTDYTNTVLEYKKSSEKSELGYNVLFIDLRREYLIQEEILSDGDSNDTQIISLRDETKNLISNGDYTNSLASSRNAMAILDKLEAPLTYQKAQDVMANAKKSGYDKNKTYLYDEASKSLSLANDNLKSGNYSDSLIQSKNVISLAALMANSENTDSINNNDNNNNNNNNNNNLVDNGSDNTLANNNTEVSSSENTIEGVFPKYYKVQSRKSRTDSLWSIASYDFIYGDGNLWRKIYEANKAQIKNPAVISEGQILTIPSLKGETREGTYDPTKTYPSIKKSSQPKKDVNNESSVKETTIKEDKKETEELKEKSTEDNVNISEETITTEEVVTEEKTADKDASVEETTEEIDEEISEEVKVTEGDVVVEDEEKLKEEKAKAEDTVVDEPTDAPTAATNE